MKRSVPLAKALALFILAPAVAYAVPIATTPDPLGDWVLESQLFLPTRILDATLLSGDTSPAPTVVLRTTIVGGGPFASTTVVLAFDFDVDVANETITASSGSFGGGPSVAASGGGDGVNSALTFNCAPAPCTVDVCRRRQSTSGM